MYKSRLAFVVGLALFSVMVGVAWGQATAKVPAGPRGEFLGEYGTLESRIVGLAEAVPADKYSWRPAPGVRSIAEVYLHIAAANFNIPKALGVAPPAGFNGKGYDTTTTDKAKIVAALKDSFAHVRTAVTNMPDADVEKQLDWFGGKNTYRGILLFMTRHCAEHLGQSIAYARMVGVTPPWSEEPKAAADKKPANNEKK